MMTTVCTNCDAQLKAPDSVEGKRVKCKKCGEAFVARRIDEDFLEEDDGKPTKPTVKMAAAKPKPKPSPDEDEDDAPPRKSNKAAAKADDDDGESEEEEAPKPKAKKKGKGKKKKQESKSPVMLFVLIGIGALLLIGGPVVYFVFIHESERKPTTPSAKGGTTTGTSLARDPAAPSVIAGWVEINEPEGKYKIKFPTQPQKVERQAPTPSGPISVTGYAIADAAESFMSTYQPLPADRKGAKNEQILDVAVELAKKQDVQGARVENTKSITYEGHRGRELILTAPGVQSTFLLRIILAGDRLIVILAGGQAVTAASPRLRAL